MEIALRVGQFWSEIKLVITNRIPATRSCDFVITRLISDLIIYMKKFIHSDWLRAVQFLGNTVPKKEIQCQKRKFSANFFRF